MARSLDEIAAEIDEACDTLQMMAEAIAGPGREAAAGFKLWTPDRREIDLRACANELREIGRTGNG